MPSTYTTNGGIELPANGEQSGTWGSTVNDNMNIVDRLTNGVGGISLSGTTHTLTTADGTPSDGHYSVLVLGGAPSGTNTITIAPNDGQHVYIVKNSSGQSAIFSQGSGANVTVLNGKSAIIYSDGAGSGAAVVDITSTFQFGTVDINGGTIDGTVIGGTTAAAGSFTSVAASGTVTATSFAGSGSALTGLFASGMIMLWSGSVVSIPSGWLLCDGTSGTPNLQNRFIVGAGDSYAVNATGGAATVTLDTTQIPAHLHGVGTLATNTAGSHNHTVSVTGTTSTASLTGSATYISETWAGYGQGSGIISKEGGYVQGGTPTSVDSTVSGKLNIDASHAHTVTSSGTTSSNGDHTHAITGSTASTGGGGSHENLPPYFALCYIMKS
jgi:microcystin-dependent protein